MAFYIKAFDNVWAIVFRMEEHRQVVKILELRVEFRPIGSRLRPLDNPLGVQKMDLIPCVLNFGSSGGSAPKRDPQKIFRKFLILLNI